MIKALLNSRKFWLMVGACVAAYMNGHPDYIPYILMANAGLIAAEDMGAKIGMGKLVKGLLDTLTENGDNAEHEPEVTKTL